MRCYARRLVKCAEICFFTNKISYTLKSLIFTRFFFIYFKSLSLQFHQTHQEIFPAFITLMLNLPAPGLQEEKLILGQTILFTENCKYKVCWELGCWGETFSSLPLTFCAKNPWKRRIIQVQSHDICSVNSINLGMVLVGNSCSLNQYSVVKCLHQN